MTKAPNLDQQLLDLIYGLLDEQEEVALRARIESEPEVGQAYAEAERTADVFARAAQLSTAAIGLKRPAASEFMVETSTEDSTAIEKPSAPAPPWKRWADWTVAVAAGVLLVVSASAFLSDDSRPSHLRGDHLRLQVTGPSVLRSGMENEYTVATSAVFGSEVEGQAADVQFALYDLADSRLLHYAQPTNEKGQLHVSVPADLDLPDSVRLEVTVGKGSAVQRVNTQVPVEPAGYLTRLTLDKQTYRPGDTIFFRSLTLSRFALTAADSLPIQLEILDPLGRTLDGSIFQDITQHGVGWGQCDLPADASGGEFTLVATSPDDQFPRRRKTFTVRHQEPPRLAMELEFTRDSFGLGETVTADFAAHSHDGRPVANARLAIQAIVDGQTIPPDLVGATSSAGAYRIQFPLPDEIESDNRRPDAQLAVTIHDGGPPETVTRRIPVNRGDLQVDFFPEGGELAALTQNRVYFTAVDPSGQPVHIEGAVLSGDVKVARVRTIHDGMGAFSFVPLPGQRYHLQIDSPAGFDSKPALPPPDPQRTIVLNTGTSVFAAGGPLEFNVRSRRAGAPLVASAVCRGVPVGRQAFVAREGANTVTLDLPEEVSGVIRLSIHDYRESPPEPLAERLVFRRRARRLDVKIQGQEQVYQPGDQVDLTVAVASNDRLDELTESYASNAYLGVAVVDRRALEPNGVGTTGPAAYFLLGAEVRNPEDLDDADFYLADDRQSELALDLLLGTQGWRRFTEVSAAELAAAGEDDPDRRLVLLSEDPPPPAMFDNLAELRRQHEECVEALQDSPAVGPGALTMIGFTGGIGLMLLVGMMSLLGISSGARLWAPTFGVAAACVILGATRMSETRPEPVAHAAVAFAQFEFSTEDGQTSVVVNMIELPQPAAATMVSDEVLEEFSDGAMEAVMESPSVADSPSAVAGQPAMEAMAAPPEPTAPAAMSPKGMMRPGAPVPPSAAPAAAMRIPSPLESPAIHRAARSAGDAPQAEEAEAAMEAFDSKESGEPFYGRRAPISKGGSPDQPRIDLPGSGSQRGRVVNLDRGDTTSRSAGYDAYKGLPTRDREANDMALRGGYGGMGGMGGGMGTSSTPRLKAGAGQAPDEGLSRRQLQRSFTAREYKWSAGSASRGLRSDSAETIYWNALATTDSEGVVRLGFPLANSVGAYRVLVEAHDDQGRLAGAVDDLVAQRPLSLQPILPTEVAVGDRIEAPLAVGNWTSTPLDVEVAVACQDGLKAEEKTARQSLASIAPQSQDKAYFPLTAVHGPTTGALQFSATAGQWNDRVERRLTIVPSGFPAVTSDAGWLQGRGELVVRLPDDRGAGSTVASLTVFPTLLSELRAGLESVDPSMQVEPEQILASISLNELTQLYMSTANLADPNLTRQTRTSLGRLARLNRIERDSSADRADGSGDLRNQLAESQAPDGSVDSSVEATAMAAIAWMRSDEFPQPTRNAVDWLVRARRSGGRFGSTRATASALATLVEYESANPRTVRAGSLLLARDGQPLVEQPFDTDRQTAIQIDGLTEGWVSGDNRLSVELTGGNRMPYLLEIHYFTSRADNDDSCPVRLTTRLEETQLTQGDSVQLTAKLVNTTAGPLASVVVILGIPAGLQVPFDQLETARDTGLIESFQTRPREVVCFRRALAAEETLELSFQAIATIPGHYTGPASRAYLDAAPQAKQWTDPLEVEISRE